ncbi:MAG: alanine racemase [Candidatus Hydrogenedentes bacterium]|nr:alanine racemase [Candidatus Hydrogenedentota bacterium]
MKTPAAPSRALIDLDAYAHNLALIRQMVPGDCGLIPVVKADAYGHGAVPVARRAVAEGAAMLAVATVNEAVALREAGIEARLLVLVTPPRDALGAAVEYDLRLTVSSVAAAERVGELARRANRVVPVHCKIDTGMGRQGFLPESAVADLLHLTRISHIDIEGVATHFAVAERPRDPFTGYQIKQFKQVLRQLDKEGVPYEMAHAANSAGIVNHPTASTFSMVRPGLMTYGVWPCDPVPDPSPLRPVLRWETEVVLMKDLASGATIGYGRTFTARQRMRAAILPVGYADGYRFALSNRADVLIRGKRCPVRGRVSMDQIVVDVTHVPGVAAGDTATLIGADGEEAITAAELAERADTIPYDILTGIGPRVERVYES